MCKDVLSYVEGETLNPSSKQNLSEFAHTLSAVQDYRNAQVTNMFHSIIICKQHLLREKIMAYFD